MRKSLLALAMVLAAGPSLADQISFADLPPSLRNCTGSGSGCLVIRNSSFDNGAMSAFAMLSGGQQSWLLRYDINGNSTDSVGAHLWMRVSSSYDLLQAMQPVTLYLDEVQGMSSRWMLPDNILELSMTSEALLAGSAHGEATLLGPSSGNMTPPAPVLLASPGFSSGATLNLLYLFFADDNGIATLHFDSSDTRSLLFSQFDRGPFGGGPVVTFTQSYFSTPVPLPAAWGLFVGSMTLLGALRRRGAASRRS